MRMSMFAMTVLAGMNTAIDAAQAPQPAAQLTGLIACRSQANDQARLKCYDQAVGALAQATAQGEVVVVNREEVRKTRRSLFGFTLPSLPFFRGDDSQDDAPELIEAKIKAARAAGHDKWIFQLEDGAVWQTTEPDNRGALPKAGDTVRIKKGVMGSYMISLPRSRPLRGIRIK